MIKKSHFIKQSIYNRIFNINNIRNNLKINQLSFTTKNYSDKNYIQKCKPLNKLEKIIHKRFISCYGAQINILYYKKIINEIVRNHNSHIVAQFKDYLIRGDFTEFLSKYNLLEDSKMLLKNLFEFYEEFSLIFPNYFILPESKYIYRNIKRKQIIINCQQEEEERKENKLFEHSQKKIVLY